MKSFFYRVYDKFTFNQLKYLKKYVDLDKLSGIELENYQLDKIVSCCKAHNLDIKSWSDFKKIPVKVKKDLPNNIPTQKYKKHETSGSTGEPRVIYVPEEAWYKKDAIFTRSWLKMGRKNEKVFRLIAGEPSYSFYDWLRNVKPMNYRTIGEKHANWVIKNKPYLIHGPGGSIRQLCELIIDMGRADVLKDIKIHWCSESSKNHKERLLPFVKQFDEQYGLAEMPTVAATDGLGNLKIVAERCYVEILDENDNPVEDGKEGFIVVTDFENNLTPIIRYKSGDRGKMKTFNDYKVLYDVVGRGVDYYNGPEVKKAIGWWIVSPISHTLGHIITQWRVEIKPKEKCLYLHYKGNVEPYHQDFDKYRVWIKENVGLDAKFIKSDEVVDYSIYWKNKLVFVNLEQ